jgi:hypothetical protein
VHVAKGDGRMPMSSAQGLNCILGYRAGRNRSARIQIFGSVRGPSMCKMVKNFMLRCAITSGMGGRATIKTELSGAYDLQHEGVQLSRQASYTSVSNRSEPMTPGSSRFHLHRKAPSTLRTGGHVLPIVPCS